MSLTAEKSVWRILVAYLLGLAGIGASVATIYATPAEGLPKLGCGLSALDCSTALTSQFSEVAGIPLGVLGLFYFSFWVLNLRAYHRTGDSIYLNFLSWITLLGAVVSLCLGTIMFFVLKAPCLYCMITHASNIGAVLVLWPLLAFKPQSPGSADHFWHFVTLTGISILSAVSLYLASENRNLQAKLTDALNPPAETLF